MNSPSFLETKSESVDVQEYFAIILKRKWLILICFLLSLAGTSVYLFTRQPIYRAKAKLLVVRTGSDLPTASVRIDEDRSFYSTELDIMRSHTMLRRVQQRMRKTNEEMNELLKALRVDRLGGADLIQVSVDSPSTDFAKEFVNTLCEEYLRYRDEQRAQSSEAAVLSLTREINRLGQELRAANERVLEFAKEKNLNSLDSGQSLIRWQFWQVLNRMGDAASDLAAALALKQHLESRPNVSVILRWLMDPESDLATTSSQPLTADESAAAFAALTTPPPTTSVGEPGAVPLLTGPAAGLSLLPPTNQMMAVGQQNLAGGQPDRPRRPNIFALSEARARQLMDLERRRHTLTRQLEEMRQIYREKHPALIKTERELAEVQQQLDIEIEFIRQTTEASIQMAQRRYDQLKATFDQLGQRVMAESTVYMELNALSEEAARIKSFYNVLLDQLMKIDVANSFSSRVVSILEQAMLEPEPVYPKKTKGLLVAAAFGLGLGLALAFFIEYIDDSIKLAEEVERDLQLPFLGMVPAAQWDPEDLTAHRLDKLKQQGGVAEAYRVVRSAVMFTMPPEKLRSILVTSAVPREGKTTTSVNMAIGLAQVQDRVLLVDGDLRRGEINKYFGFERNRGLADILLGEATPEEVVRHTDVPKLDVITCGSYPLNPAELLLGWRLKEFLDWAYQHYSRVVFDGPPVMGIADSAILGAAVDGVMLIIWAGRTSRRYVRVAKMNATSCGAKIFGFMLNNLEPGRVGYYHYYPYYYSYYSRGYYYTPKGEQVEVGVDGEVKSVEVPPEKEKEKNIEDVY